MSSKLRKQIDVEWAMLHQLLEDHSPLLQKCCVVAPDRIEVSALAAMLHGFYCGLENVLKRISVETNEPLSKTPGWHKELLGAMTRSSAKRPAVLTIGTACIVREYLEFRHFFRSAYPFQLRWERMAHLACDCEKTLQCFQNEVETFLLEMGY